MFRRPCAVFVGLNLVTVVAMGPSPARGHVVAGPSIATLTVAALGWTAPEPAASGYIVTEVEGLINVAGINDAGQMIGNDYTAAFLWDEGNLIELGTLGGELSHAAAINEAGQIVGHSSITQTDPNTGTQLVRPFLWLPEPAYGLPAGMHNLGTLGDDYHSYADDINDLGQVVGHSRPAGLNHAHAFRWQNGVMTDLGSFGAADNTSEANGINNLGQVVGWSYDDEIVRHAILFDNGQLIDLGSLGGFAWGSNPLSEAFDINEAGQIAGQSFAEPRPGDSQRHVFNWSGGEMTDLNELGGYLRNTYVRAINNAGHIIGDTDVHGGVLWKNGRLIALSDEIAATGWFVYSALDINDHGQIAVRGKHSNGQAASLLLTPDCNGNGLPDHQEIAADPGMDLNANGVPDGCDSDCNGNGLPDDLDVSAGSSPDLNGNGVPDECGEFDDCNTNGVPDFLDIEAGLSQDFNANHLPDDCESHGTIHVDAAATGLSGQDGSVSSPFATIKQAIELSLSGDVIELAEGLYTGPDNRNINFGGRSVTVRSADPDDPTVVANTIIDAGQAGRAFAFFSGEPADAVLDGLTIQNGRAEVPLPLGSRGGAIFCHNSSPTIRNCVISGNSAGIGGGISLEYSNATIINSTITANDNDVPCYECGGAGFSANLFCNPTILGCTINDNAENGVVVLNQSNLTFSDSTISGHHAVYQGGGIICDGSCSATLNNCALTNNSAADGGAVLGVVSMTGCLIANNTANGDGGGVSGGGTFTDCVFQGNSAGSEGGALYGEAALTGCTIVDNDAGFSGGGLSTTGSTSLTECLIQDNSTGYNGAGIDVDGGIEMANCTVTGNTAGAGTSHGGGISISWNDDPQTMTNCVVAGNSAKWGGGLYVFESGLVSVTNCTFSGNTATTNGPQGGAAIYLQQMSNPLTLTNSIVWDNEAADGKQVSLISASMTVAYSAIEGGQAGVTLQNGTVPASLTWGNGNLAADPLLTPNCHLVPGSSAIDAGDNTAVPTGVSSDLDDNARFVDDPDTIDAGVGPAPVVDLGAFEYQATPVLLGDMNCDGAVDLDDVPFFVQAMIEEESFAGCMIDRADMDSDTLINGKDIQHMVIVLMNP